MPHLFAGELTNPPAKRPERRAREAGDSADNVGLSPAPRADNIFPVLVLGLAPQALCLRLLRRLNPILQTMPHLFADELTSPPAKRPEVLSATPAKRAAA